MGTYESYMIGLLLRDLDVLFGEACNDGSCADGGGYGRAGARTGFGAPVTPKAASMASVSRADGIRDPEFGADA